MNETAQNTYMKRSLHALEFLLLETDAVLFEVGEDLFVHRLHG